MSQDKSTEIDFSPLLIIDIKISLNEGNYLLFVVLSDKTLLKYKVIISNL